MFLVLLYRGLISSWRTLEREYARSPRSHGRSLRRLFLTRVLPYVLLLVLIQLGGAWVGAATGHGAMSGLVVVSLALMGTLAVGAVVAAVFVGLRGARRGA